MFLQYAGRGYLFIFEAVLVFISFHKALPISSLIISSSATSYVWIQNLHQIFQESVSACHLLCYTYTLYISATTDQFQRKYPYSTRKYRRGERRTCKRGDSILIITEIMNTCLWYVPVKLCFDILNTM